MIKAGIIGATGYAGVELVRILLRHPHVTLTAISSVSFEGKPISEVYPSLRTICDMACESADAVIERCDVIFAALPHGLSQDTAKACADAGKKFIDLGADFRLDDPDAYEAWYQSEYRYDEIHKQAVYGLCEWFREDIKATTIIGNPGCYPTSAALGLAPALKNKLVSPKGIIIDSKSGTTGAGRKPTQTTHFPDCADAFSAYKVASHRHTPEIEQTLSKLAGEDASITFVPHLLPVNRGILSTIYARLNDGVTEEALRSAYEEAYKDEQFVRVMPKGQAVNIRHVQCSNYCDIQLYVDTHTQTLVVTSVIDNMVKGAAGQAIQNMNLLCGLPEAAGLDMIPIAF